MLERRCMAAGHRQVDEAFPAVPSSELALCVVQPAREPVRHLAETIREFCEAEMRRLAGQSLRAVEGGAVQATATWMTG